MTAKLIHASDLNQLAAAVNAARAEGGIPNGGLLYWKGQYFQLVVDGASTVTYSIVAQQNDTEFLADLQTATAGGAFALGAPLQIDGYFVQAVGDMAGAGGGGGTELPDGTNDFQSLQWDTGSQSWIAGVIVPEGTTDAQVLEWNSTTQAWEVRANRLPNGTTQNQALTWSAGGGAWVAGYVPTRYSVYGEGSQLGSLLPTVHVTSGNGYVTGAMVVNGTGQTIAGIYVADGGNIRMAVTATTNLWQVVGPTGTGAVQAATTGTVVSGPASNFNVTCGTSQIQIQAGGATRVDLTTATLRPSALGPVDLGVSGLPFRDLYVVNAPTVTSDARLKSTPDAIPDALMDAVGEVDLIRYKLLADIAENGDAGAHYHVGVIAQQVISAFAAHGINALEYGIVQHDEWEEIPAEYDAEGNEVVPAVPAGDRYTVRYEELLVLEAARVRRELAKLSSN